MKSKKLSLIYIKYIENVVCLSRDVCSFRIKNFKSYYIDISRII